MSDFPRGWTLTNFANPGTAASITLSALSAGVVHVLDSVTATLAANAAAAVGVVQNVVITSSDGVLSNNALILAYAGGAIGCNVGSLSGLDLAAGPGASLTVSFQNTTPANYYQLLVIQGHDI